MRFVWEAKGKNEKEFVFSDNDGAVVGAGWTGNSGARARRAAGDRSNAERFDDYDQEKEEASR